MWKRLQNPETFFLWCLYEYIASSAGSSSQCSINSILIFNLFFLLWNALEIWSHLLPNLRTPTRYFRKKQACLSKKRLIYEWRILEILLLEIVLLMFIDCTRKLISKEWFDTIKLGRGSSWVTMIPHPGALRWVWGQEHRPSDQYSQMLNDVISERSVSSRSNNLYWGHSLFFFFFSILGAIRHVMNV